MSERRWWGWIEPSRPLGDRALRLLERELGGPLPLTPPVPFDAVRLPERSLAAATEQRLRGAVGDENVRVDREARVGHAAGKGYVDLVRLRAGDAAPAPDAVVVPGSADEVRALLELCSRENVAVVPFGGGTSVVGGVEPLRGSCDAVISLDLERLDGLSIDHTSLTASFGAGLRAPPAEELLGRAGLTLGHFPQSFELATIGGYVATRSAGQASTGYGRIDGLVKGIRLCSPAGDLALRPVPASAAGPALRELVVGSEGALGVIVEATLQVRAAPGERRYEGWSFRSFGAGCAALRRLAQSGPRPDVARLSDEEETRMTLGMSSTGSRAELAGRLYLRARGHARGCLAIVGFEGSSRDVDRRARLARSVLRAHGGMTLGSRPGEAWRASRYAGPYLRDELLGRGLLVETLETATTWARLDALHRSVGEAIRSALAQRGERSLVGCHVSHLYPTGASLYFTFIARREHGSELQQWEAAKRAASEAIVAHGATITHHHAVGRDHSRWLGAEVGDLGIDALRAVKARLDPAGIMNPGKLLP